MSDRLLIYGAPGYSGALIARQAVAAGLTPILCARNAEKLRVLSDELGLESRVAGLDDPGELERTLRGVDVVLNAAGPFSRTARQLIDACLRVRCHYLDITGEVDAILVAAERGSAARERGVMLMPAVGFDVMPSDCLAVHAVRRSRRPRHLRLGLSGLAMASRGSARTMIELLHQPIRLIRDGRLTSAPLGSLEWEFDYGWGASASLAIGWGDIATAPFSTGVANVTTYFEANLLLRMHNGLVRALGWAAQWRQWQAFLEANLWLLPEGPSAEYRERRSVTVVAEVEDEDGSYIRSRLRTPEAYTMTALAALAVTQRVLAGDLEPGFETPARVYGPDFVLSLPGVERQDL